ncbi:MAG: glycosyl transferase family 36 [Candidatus Ozemobacteraceae bacterium]
MNLLAGPYGHFSPDGTEYHITNWQTPRPWINVISNGRWGVTVSQAGGGYSWLDHAMLNRITRWNQDIVRDGDGKFFLIQDMETGITWSLTPQPLKPAYETFTCTHGLGYTTFASLFDGIEAELTVFVPQTLKNTTFEPGKSPIGALEAFPGEIWTLSIHNTTGKPKSLRVISYFEPLLNVFPDWHREFLKCFLRSSYDAHRQAVIFDNTLWTAPLPGDAGWNKDWPYRFFFTADRAPTSFTCDREEFFGRHNAWHDGDYQTRKVFSNRTGTGFEQAVATSWDIVLPGNGTDEMQFCLGVLERDRFDQELPVMREAMLKAPETLAATRQWWLDLCHTFTVETPEPAVNVLLNYWLKYQAVSGRLLGRSAFYQCGGAFGFRDQLQDSQVWLTIDPGRTRSQILMHAKHQQADGTVQHWWHPISEEGRLTDISDDLLWLPYITNAYIEETGDHSILAVTEPWLDGGEAPLYEHCVRAIEKALERRSPRGLSLIGEGDWNDGLNAVGPLWKGESIWLSHFLVGVLRSFAPYCRTHGTDSGQKERAGTFENAARDLTQALLGHAWDGDWFIRATKDSGEIIGSSKCEEGKIYLNAQTWGVINGVVEGDRANHLLDQVEKYLYKEYGILLFTPAYSKVDKGIGYLTRYSPGVRENGGCYTHAAIWAAYAQAKAGRVEHVWDTLRRLCPPLLSNADPDAYGGEPYVTPGNIEGPESVTEGRGAWTWYSGSSTWLYKAMVDTLLGITVENGDLAVRPNLPSSWEGFSVIRPFRGQRVKITVKRSPPDSKNPFEIVREILSNDSSADATKCSDQPLNKTTTREVPS